MYEHYCRCCLAANSGQYYSLFEKNKSDTRTFAETIHQFTGIKVQLEDGLPQFMCGICYAKIEDFIAFALIVSESDEKLRNRIDELSNKHSDNATTSTIVLPMESNRDVIEKHCIDVEEYQDNMSECILEEEVISIDEENIHQQPTEISIFEEYAKDDSGDDLQMVEEILEYVEEVPNENMPKETDLLHELAYVAATQESVRVQEEQTQNKAVNTKTEEFFFEDECDNEFLIEFNPAEEMLYNFKPPKWKCVECKKILRGDVSYEGHMNIHKNLRPHKCSQCHSQFRCRNALKRHKTTRHSSNHSKETAENIEEISILHLKCLDCNIEFQSEVELFKHELIAHKAKHASETKTCRLCPNTVVENLIKHVENVHAAEPTEVEQSTEENTAETQVETLPAGTAVQFFNCSLCTKAFSCISALRRHHKSQQHLENSLAQNEIRLQQGTVIDSWQCDICMEICNSLNEINKHRQSCCGATLIDDTIEMDEYDWQANSPKDGLVKCDLCKKRLQRKNLSKHMALHERKVKDAAEETATKFLCAYCPRKFKNTKTLNQHEKTHRGETADIVYVCADCDRQYASQVLLETHRKQAHKERDHVCSICGNAFKLKNQLVNHMKLHLEKNIHCPHCDKKYARQFDLNVHLRSHTGELPFACHLCEKRFAIKVRLTYHLQRHYGVKHQCKECNAEFNSRQKLKAHSFKHTGMPYRCELCDDHGFPNRVVFKRHLDRVHHAEMSDEALNEMFQRNTGKTIKIKQINTSYDNKTSEDGEIVNMEDEEIVEDEPVLINSTDIIMKTEIILE